MNGSSTTAALGGRTAGEGRVFLLRIWVGVPPRTEFRALVRPIGSEQWRRFTNSEELVDFLAVRPSTGSDFEPDGLMPDGIAP